MGSGWISCRLRRGRARSRRRGAGPARDRLEVRGRLLVPVPPEEAWARFARVEDWPRWDWLGSASARWVMGEPWTVGAVLRLGHRPFLFRCVVVEVDPPRSVTWHGGGLGIDARRTFSFQPHPAGTLVESHEIFAGRGARRVKRLVRWYWGVHLRAFRRYALHEAAAARRGGAGAE